MRKLFLATLITALVMGIAASAFAEALVTIGKGSVRSEPSENAKKIDSVECFDWVQILGESGGFLKVRTKNGKVGYLKKGFATENVVTLTFEDGSLFGYAVAQSKDWIALLMPSTVGSVFILADELDARARKKLPMWEEIGGRIVNTDIWLDSSTRIYAAPTTAAPTLAERINETVWVEEVFGKWYRVRFLENTDNTGDYCKGVGYIYVP